MRPTRIAAARPIAVPPPEANLGFYADRVHWNSLTLDACRALSGQSCGWCAVNRPRFSSNLSTFMSNCISVVTTLERNVSGRCRTTILPQAHAFPRADTSPHGAFFIAVHA